MQIFKYTLSPSENTLVLPKGYEVLSVLNQRDNIVLYALVDSTLPSTETVHYKVVGTGHYHNNSPKWKFLGSVSLMAGDLIFHVFLSEEVTP